MISAEQMARFSRAFPFWVSLTVLPLAVLAVIYGGILVAFVPLFAWTAFILLDALTGDETENADPTIEDKHLGWYRLITLIWFPIQIALVFWALWHVTRDSGTTFWEAYFLFFGIGVSLAQSGSITATS